MHAAAQILDAVEQAKEQGWAYDLDASFVEVYNEGLRDLLADGHGRDAGKLADQNAVKHGVGGAQALHLSAPMPRLAGCLTLYSATASSGQSARAWVLGGSFHARAHHCMHTKHSACRAARAPACRQLPSRRAAPPCICGALPRRRTHCSGGRGGRAHHHAEGRGGAGAARGGGARVRGDRDERGLLALAQRVPAQHHGPPRGQRRAAAGRAQPGRPGRQVRACARTRGQRTPSW